MKKSVIVYHSTYGCDTGCCGHVVELDDGREKFDFDHPWHEDHRAFAERMIRETFGEEHIKDLDWNNCLIREE